MVKNKKKIKMLHIPSFLDTQKPNIIAKSLKTPKSVLTVYYYHVTYAIQSESTLYSCLNVKGLLARIRHDI